MTDLSNSSSLEQDRLDTFVFSHLRWDFVYQRPQHLMSRFASLGRVFFIEEPMPTDGEAHLDVSAREGNVFVVRSMLPEGSNSDEAVPQMIGELAREQGSERYIAWFYTPMMMEWKRELKPAAIVYDCMDELSLFKGAPPELMGRERELFSVADAVFTGGRSLYEAKREQHKNVHAFPSSIDAAHFATAMEFDSPAAEQAQIGHPIVGFAGVIDERLDLGLLAQVADMRPDMNFVMVGPVVKISEDDLPRRDNIHYLGGQDYKRLPEFMSGWDVAMMPFALNDSTKFISPTKTPEYLAAGLPVVSTPIVDVVRPYGVEGYVHIASNAEEFSKAIDAALSEDRDRRLARVRMLMADMSWDKTFREMKAIVDKAIQAKTTTGGYAPQGSAEHSGGTPSAATTTT
jgi:glycosyltransferase involved in cell wall biosynthesis